MRYEESWGGQVDCVSCKGHAQNCNAHSIVKVGSDYSEEFEIGGRCPPGALSLAPALYKRS